jgi:hypothetical protein
VTKEELETMRTQLSNKWMLHSYSLDAQRSWQELETDFLAQQTDLQDRHRAALKQVNTFLNCTPTFSEHSVNIQ